MNKELPSADFHDQRNDMAYWFPKLRDIEVPTPESQPLPIEPDDEGKPVWDTDLASEIVQCLGGKAFARGGYKSAQMQLSRGSIIFDASHGQVDSTLKELVSQQAMMQMPLGDSLWLREYLDVNWNHYARQNQNPEVRAFIRDGEVVCYHPRLEGFDGDEDNRESAIDQIERAWPREVELGERRHEGLITYAERVADEFDGWWSVDFVMDVNGDWWCTDMALDALYERDGQVRGMSDHPEECEHDIEVLHDE
jgi:hypothetical protein